MRKYFLILLLFINANLIQYSHADHSVIKVGAILILSGNNSEYGIHAQRGAQIAIDEINNAGGIAGKKLQFIWEDETSGKAERAVSAYRKLTSIDQVEYIFGPSFQDGLLAIAPIAKKDKMFIITPSTPSLGLENIFSTWADPEIESELIAEHIFVKYKKIAVLSAQQSWELLVADAFKRKLAKLGGTLAYYADPLNSNFDLKPEVLKLRQSNPEAVFISSYTLFPYYVKELRHQGVSVPIFTIEADGSIISAAGAAAEGVVSLGPAIPETGFSRIYKNKFSANPDMPAYQAFDAVKMLAEAIRSQGSGTENVKKYFKNFSNYEGASGTISNLAGKVSVSTDYFEVRNGILERM